MIEDKLEFNEEGIHYFADSGHIYEAADGYNFVKSAYVIKDDLRDGKNNVLYIEFIDGYLSEFESEEIAEELDEKLESVKGVVDVSWEDQELFRIVYKKDQDVFKLIKRIDSKVTRLSELVE